MPDNPGLEAGHTAASGPPGPPDATVGPDEALNETSGPLVPLPSLSRAELDVLALALEDRRRAVASGRATRGPGRRQEMRISDGLFRALPLYNRTPPPQADV